MLSRISMIGAACAAFALSACSGGADKPPPTQAGDPQWGGPYGPPPEYQPGYRTPAEVPPTPVEGFPDAGRAPAPAPVRPAAATVAPPAPADLPATTGRAVNYDHVGFAEVSNETGSGALHRSLPPGSYVEVTAIDSGKTVLVVTSGTSSGGAEIALSAPVAAQLGIVGRSGVRVRIAKPSPADMATLRAGQAAPTRPDAPPVILNALRKKLTGVSGKSPARAAPMPRPIAAADTRPPARAAVPVANAMSAARGRYYVQVAAFSDAARAQSVARALGGSVAGGSVNRVRLGPFATEGEARAARERAAARGFGDARIVRQD